MRAAWRCTRYAMVRLKIRISFTFKGLPLLKCKTSYAVNASSHNLVREEGRILRALGRVRATRWRRRRPRHTLLTNAPLGADLAIGGGEGGGPGFPEAAPGAVRAGKGRGPRDPEGAVRVAEGPLGVAEGVAAEGGEAHGPDGPGQPVVAAEGRP